MGGIKFLLSRMSSCALGRSRNFWVYWSVIGIIDIIFVLCTLDWNSRFVHECLVSVRFQYLKA